MRAKTLFVFAILTVLICFTVPLNLLQHLFLAKASPANVYVSPAMNTVDPPEVGKTFTVDIAVDYVEMVWGWELKLSFDPFVVTTTESMIKEGSFLTQYGAQSEGTVAVFSTYLGAIYNIKGVDWVDGEGVLLSIDFTVVDTGRSLLHLYDTEFVDVDREPIFDQPVPSDGEFYTQTPHASFYYLPSKDPQETQFPYPEWLKRNPIVDEQITFNASYFLLGGKQRGSYDPDGSIISYEWDFDDGQTATGPVVTHAYAQASLETPDKDYAVNLIVTDNEGKTSSYVAHPWVEKHDVAVTKIDASPTVASPGEDVSIKVTIKNLGLSVEYANVTLFSQLSGVDTLIWYNQTEHKPAFSTALETDPVSRVPPLEFPPGKSIIINYTWTTTGLDEGEYTLWANTSLTDRSGKRFLKDIYQKELDYDITNNLHTNGVVTIFQLHNIAVTKIALSPTLKSPDIVQYGTTQVAVNITAANTGDFSESFYVTLNQDSTLLNNWTDITLQAKTSTILEFTWDIASLPMGYYNLTAKASIVPGEVEMGRTEDNTHVLRAAITHPPLASFTYSPAKPLARELVTFNATSSSAAAGWAIKSYEWRINGTVEPTLVGATPSPMPFTQIAAYNITLTVTDSLDLTTSTSKLIYIYVLPTANFTCSPTSPKVGEATTFDASSSYDTDPSSVITHYAWDFGEDQTAEGKIAVYTYTVRGDYNVTLTVTDSDDHQASLRKKITVIQEPAASFDFSPTGPTVDQIITFDASASQPYGGQITEYKWDLGDGVAPITVQEPIFKRKYSKAGSFNVALTITDSEGLSNTMTKSITITKLASSVSMTASPSALVVGQTVTIVGQISPSVAGVTIMIYYREGTGPWIWLQNRTTSDTGRYSYDWVTATPGSFQLKAQWAGNEKYNSDESDPTQSIIVQGQVEQLPPEIPYIVGGVIALIVILVIVYVFLKRRKTP